MAIKPTIKGGGVPLAAFYQNGWTTAQLIEHGYAVEEADPPQVIVEIRDVDGDHVRYAVAPKKVEKWKEIAKFGKCGNDSDGQLLPNPFGLTTTAQVRAIWEDVSPVANYKNGYSFEQQIVFAAMELTK